MIERRGHARSAGRRRANFLIFLGPAVLLTVVFIIVPVVIDIVVSFTDLKQYSVLTLARDPWVPVVAGAAALLLLGLVPSLYVTRRRVWVRAVPAGAGGARVELAGLALQGKAAFEAELARLAQQVQRGTLGPPTEKT